MKLNSLGNFVPLYFSPTWTFLLPRSSPELYRARKFGFLVISENYYTNYKHLVRLFGSTKGNINFLKLYCNLSLICLYIVLFITQYVRIYNFVNSS